MRPAAVVVLCAAIIGASASAVQAQGFSYGVKGGVTLADLQTDGGGTTPTPFDFRVGVVAGGFLTWPFGGRLALQPEVLFTQKGAKAELGGGTSVETLEYLDVPVLISYRLTGSADRHFNLFGGPSIGVRLRARSRASFGGASIDQDISDQVKSTDLGVTGGVAYHRGRFVADGRYSWGLTDIDKEAGDELTITTRGMSFLIGWRF